MNDAIDINRSPLLHSREQVPQNKTKKRQQGTKVGNQTKHL